jgi:hypothetical protein
VAGVLAQRRGWAYEAWPGTNITVLETSVSWPVTAVPAPCPLASWTGRGRACGMASSWRRLSCGLPGIGRGMRCGPALLTLLWLGRLSTDLARPLCGTSVLRRRA